MLAHTSYEGVGATNEGLGLSDWQTWLLIGFVLLIAVPHYFNVR
jgi:hypothetical protein